MSSDDESSDNRVSLVDVNDPIKVAKRQIDGEIAAKQNEILVLKAKRRKMIGGESFLASIESKFSFKFPQLRRKILLDGITEPPVGFAFIHRDKYGTECGDGYVITYVWKDTRITYGASTVGNATDQGYINSCALDDTLNFYEEIPEWAVCTLDKKDQLEFPSRDEIEGADSTDDMCQYLDDNSCPPMLWPLAFGVFAADKENCCINYSGLKYAEIHQN